MTEAGTQEFDRAEFDRALALLEREQRAMHLTRAQRISYRLYSVFIWGLAVSVVGLVLFFGFSQREQDWADIAGTACAVALCVCIAGGVVSSILNLPLILKMARQKRAIRRLGISDASEVVWKVHRKTRRWGRLPAQVLLLIGIALAVGGIAVALFNHDQDERIAGWVLAIAGVLIPPFYLVQNGKEWLDVMSSRWTEISDLRQSMQLLANTTAGPGGQSIMVPAETVKQIARIETERIVRTRADALAESVTASQTAFSVLSSREVLNAKAKLSPAERLHLQDTLDGLTLEPKPGSATPDPESGLLVHTVDGTALELLYQVDEPGRLLKAVALRQRSAVGSAAHA
jgi:hypothetical protein